MIKTDKFIFIHLFRSGGTFINEFLENNFTNFKMVGYHRPLSLIPDKYNNLPVVGNVRNPWDWYVSVYYHCLNTYYPMGTKTILNFILDFKRYDFKESIKRLIDKSWMTDIDKEKALSHFPNTHNWEGKYLDNITKDDFISYLESDMGFFSWLIERMYLDENKSLQSVHLCRTEDLRREFIRFLTHSTNVSRKEINKLKINIINKSNSDGHHNNSYVKLIYDNDPYLSNNFGYESRDYDYKKYYDEELKELIYLKDKKYIDYFGYKYDGIITNKRFIGEF